ncbi:hypothetical protein Ddye_028843 [Dipteronia dyeriana]|uniref:Cytochrome P450 n=1 Tax=Dipteronia dyeriana TaxID=168575 RepID=A0AAD9WK24_9ROSI|nr:hypothetical protein Ddye_028843 [Dipteronia dyeriana]
MGCRVIIHRGDGMFHQKRCRFGQPPQVAIYKYLTYDHTTVAIIRRWLDNGDSEKRVSKLGQRMDVFLQGLIEEHRKNNDETQLEYYTEQIIKWLVLVMLLAGNNKSAVTMEWVMLNLLNQPEVLKKARDELDAQVGPLLLPHMSLSECTMEGYDVPADTILLVNEWAIHRDPKLWEDPTSFKPERFENYVDGGDQNQGHKLMPSAVGGRACSAGAKSGQTVKCFEWAKVDGKEIVDITEGKGMTMPKAEPLVAMCNARPVVGTTGYAAPK